jgi:hypothetical protein
LSPPVNKKSLDGSSLKYVPLAGFNPGLTLGIATLANIKKQVWLISSASSVTNKSAPRTFLEWRSYRPLERGAYE